MECLKADVTVLNFFGSYSSRPSTIVHDTWVEQSAGSDPIFSAQLCMIHWYVWRSNIKYLLVMVLNFVSVTIVSQLPTLCHGLGYLC